MSGAEIEISLRFPTPVIDETVLKLLPDGCEAFLQEELSRRHIEGISLEPEVSSFGRVGAAAWHPASRKIFLNASYDEKALIRCVEGVMRIWTGVDAKIARLFTTLHEIRHSDGFESEDACDEYARDRVLAWWRGRERRRIANPTS